MRLSEDARETLAEAAQDRTIAVARFRRLVVTAVWAGVTMREIEAATGISRQTASNWARADG